VLLKELIRGEADVFDYLPQEGWRDVSAGVERNGGLATVGVSELFMGPPLADLLEAQGVEDCRHLPRLEDGEACHEVRLRRSGSR
jgi:hypothetical protein